eukprot:TRINITY_DN3818_c0_g1_i1.p1 TRINITY_DN3818_c0_g1~~TRINITY_DN3818_c0_g1_i1.p1  ORF type:complete len:447 (+),score=157.11 TRINITY_DN3818_c0_g1_i1:67-1341(+)
MLRCGARVAASRCLQRRSYCGPGAPRSYVDHWKGPGHEVVMDLLAKGGGTKVHDPTKLLEEGKEMMDGVGFAAAPHVFGVHPVVQSVYRIDPLAQMFDAHGVMMMTWREPAADDAAEGSSVRIGTCTQTPPRPQFSNAIGSATISPPEWATVTQPGLVQAVWRWSGTFRTDMDLYNFPYDHQEFSIVVWFPDLGSVGPHYGRVAVPYNCNRMGTRPTVQLDQSLAEWDVYDPTLRFWMRRPFREGKPAEFAPGGKMAMIVHLRTVRKGAFFVRMMSTMCVIASLGFAAFALDVTQVSERMSMVISLLLALIAFKFTVAGSLPKVSYATQFDKYMDSTIILLAGLVAGFAAQKGAIRHELLTEEGAEWFERSVWMPAAGLAWVAYHIVIIARFRRHLTRARTALGAPRLPWHSTLHMSIPRMGFV